MISQSLTQEVSQMEADLCFALADPTRIPIPQSSTSRHLKVLRERGLVTSTRKGTNIEYRLTDNRLIQALDLLRSILCDRIVHRASLMEEADAE